MTDHTPRPEPNDSGPGDSQSDVGAREPEPQHAILSLGPDGMSLEPAVGLPPRQQFELLAGEFCQSWDGTVAPGDVLAVITIASAVCRIAAIVIPLFLRSEAGRQWFIRRLHQSSRRHFRGRSEAFHESFAVELGEFLWSLPDNGVSRGEVEAMLSELRATPNGNHQRDHR